MDKNRTDTGPGPGYETSDADVGSLVRYGVILFVTTLFAFLAMIALLSQFDDHHAATARRLSPMARTDLQVPPEPRLQLNERAELAQSRAEEDAILESYGWIDRAAGVTRIPIARAIELLTERGLPAREGSR